MQYTINTENKTITLLENVSVRDLILELQANLKDWEEYTIIPYIVFTSDWYYRQNPYDQVWKINYPNTCFSL